VTAGQRTHCDERAKAASRRRFAGRQAGLLLVVPAIVTLAASPAEAAGPGQHLVEVCTAQGVTWMALPDSGRLPPDDPAKAGSHATCAHILRPRALLRPRRDRAGL